MATTRRGFMTGVSLSAIASMIPVGPVKAFWHGSGRLNKTVQNVSMAAQAFPYINFSKADVLGPGSNSPTLLNDDGNPIAGPLTANFVRTHFLPSTGGTTQQWVFKWVGTVGAGSVGWQVNGNYTFTADNTGGHTSVILSPGTFFTTIRGNNGRFVFTFNVAPSENSQITSFFQSGCTFSGFSNFVLCRLQDEAAVDAGAIWNPDFLSILGTLGPGVLRPMAPTIGGFGNETVTNPQWALRIPLTATSYASRRPYIASQWSNTIILSGNAYTASAYPAMPGARTDGEVFMGLSSGTVSNFSVTSVASSGGKVQLTLPPGTVSQISTGDFVSYTGYTIGGGVTNYSNGIFVATVTSSTTIELTTSYWTALPSVFAAFVSAPGTISLATIDVGGLGKVPIIGFGGTGAQIIVAGVTGTGLPNTFVYNGLLKAWMVNGGTTGQEINGALFTGINPELIVNLLNTLATAGHPMDYWFNFTIFGTIASAQSAITFIRDNLNPSLNCVFESSNEMWNFTFNQFTFCWLSALALNLTTTINTSTAQNLGYAFQGLRTAMLVDAMQPIWSATRPAAQFKPTLTNWALTGFQSTFDMFKLQGSLLNASTNAVLSAYTGGQRYDQGTPQFNRPVDKCRLWSLAPYITAQLSSQLSFATWIGWAQQYATGAQATALSNFDAFIRDRSNIYAGTVAGNNAIYPSYDTLCGSYDVGTGNRPASMGNAEIWCYEGATEIDLPTIPDYVTGGATVSSTVTFNLGNTVPSTGIPAVAWPASTPVNGTRLRISSTGTLPFGINPSVDNYVINAIPSVGFDIATTVLTPAVSVPIVLSGSPTGTASGVAAQYSIDNLTIGWQNDAVRAPAWVSFYSAQMQSATWPHWKKAAFLTLEGFNPWSLWPGPLDSARFQTAVGVSQFNTGAN